MEVEDDRLVGGEQAVELALGRSVRVLRRRLQLEEVDHVDEAHLQVRKALAQDRGRRQRLLRGDVAAGGHDDVGLLALVVLARSQMPMPFAQCTMASSIVVNCRCFCLSATMTLMQSVERRH